MLHRLLLADLIFEISRDIDCDIQVDSQVYVDVCFDGKADETLQVLGPLARDTKYNRSWTLAESLEM